MSRANGRADKPYAFGAKVIANTKLLDWPRPSNRVDSRGYSRTIVSKFIRFFVIFQ